MNKMLLAMTLFLGLLAATYPTQAAEPQLREDTRQIIETVKAFRLEAIAEPIATLKKYTTKSGLRAITRIEDVLITETPRSIGWSSYFVSSTYSVAPLPNQSHVVLFYHPWSDTAIMTVWQYVEKRFVITRAELLLGDYIRQYGQPPFELQPLWERESQNITPLLAVPLAVGQTLTAFDNIFPASGQLEDASPLVKKKLDFEKNSQEKETGKSICAAANWRFERSITALVRYEQDTKFQAYRQLATSLLASIGKGNLSGLTRTIPQTSQETFDLIQANHQKVGRQFKVVSVLLSPKDCFIFLNHPADPNHVLVFWFQTDQGKYGLRQAYFMNHNFSIFSTTYLNQIKDMFEKTPKP